MEQGRYINTIGEGVRERVTGIGNLELVLGDPYKDDYNLHDSVIQWFHYDQENYKLDVEIEVIGSMYDYPTDKDIFIHFCFENVVALNVDFDGWHDISEMRLRIENNYLVCEFSCYYMEVWAEHLTIGSVVTRPHNEE